MSKYSRQIDIINVDELSIPINVIGAGGIGSWTTLLLAKIGCPDIRVYDFDTVEEHNCASQFFEENQIGMNKIDALRDNVFKQTGTKISTFSNIETENDINEGIVILAIDSMEERIRLGELYKDKNIYIIDGRMGGLQLEVYSCHSSHYPKTTVNPDHVQQDPCTAKAISFNCAVIAGLIVNQVRLYLKGKEQNGQLVYLFDENKLLKEYFI